MYNPSFKIKNNKVPILSKDNLEIHGEKFIYDYCPEALKKPMEIDAENFIELYLGLSMDYQFLSHDGRFLGMMVFNETDKVMIYTPEENRLNYLHVNAGTVIIDNRLLLDKQEHRRRFTLFHEGGHKVYHSNYYYYDPNQITLFDTDMNDAIFQCRSNLNETLRNTNHKNWTDEETMEYQANAFASVMLMPKKSVNILASDFKNSMDNPIPLIQETSKVFNVSNEAATYRLKLLGLIPQNTDYTANKIWIDNYPFI